MQNFIFALLTSSVVMLVISLLYLAFSPILSKHLSSKSMYYAWLVIIIAFIIPFRPTSENTTLITVDVTPLLTSLESVDFYIPQAYQNAGISFAWWQIVFGIWAAGAVASLAFYAIRHFKFVKTVKRWSKPVSDETILNIFAVAKAELGIKRRIELLESSGTSGPILLGIFKPRIFLPSAELSTKELKFILMHELTHYRRGDLFYKMLVLIATSIHWFNPVIYMVSKAINVHCEISCDAEVVNGLDTDARLGYSETIIAAARFKSRYRTHLVTNFCAGKKSMKKRIVEIMSKGGKKARFGGVALALFLAATSTFAFGTFTVSAIEAGILMPSRQAERTGGRAGGQVMQGLQRQTALDVIQARSYEVGSATTVNFTHYTTEVYNNNHTEITSSTTQYNQEARIEAIVELLLESEAIDAVDEVMLQHEVIEAYIAQEPRMMPCGDFELATEGCRNGGRGRGRMNNASSYETLTARGLSPLFDSAGEILIWLPELVSQGQVDEIVAGILLLGRYDLAEAVQTFWLQQ